VYIEKAKTFFVLTSWNEEGFYLHAALLGVAY